MNLLSGCENARRFIGYAEGESCARAEFCQTENRGGVESQPRRSDLRADAKLTDAFRPQRRVAAPGADAPVDFADQIDAVVDAVDSRETVKQNVVLRKAFERRGHYSESDIAEHIEPRRVVFVAAAESFLHENFAENVYLIRPDAARLIRIRHLKTEFETEGG